MAEAVGLAASILGIAGAGISITTTLYRFNKSYQGVDRKVESIATTVSVTASILTELGNATKEHPEDLQKLNRWALFSDTIAACKKDFEIIEVAIGKARKDGATVQDQQKIKKNSKYKITPWLKFRWAIGEEKDIDDLFDGTQSHPSGSKGISFDGQKTPSDYGSSVPQPQDVKNGQKRSHAPDNLLTVLTASSNHDDRKDSSQPPNVQGSLPSPGASTKHVQDISQETSRNNYNHTTGDPLPPAAESHLLDSGKYEAWSLTYRKAHVRRDNRYLETVVMTRPFKLTRSWVTATPASYTIAQFRPSKSEHHRSLSVLEKGAIPVIEVIQKLPLAAQKAVENLLERKETRYPSVAKVKIVKPPLWWRLIGRRKNWPSLIVFLEFSDHEFKDDDDDLENAIESTRTERKTFKDDDNVFIQPIESHRPECRAFMNDKDDSIKPIESRRHHRRSICRQSLISDNPLALETIYTRPLRSVYYDSLPRREASLASTSQTLPSEQEAERIMEEFLSKLTASQDAENSTRQVDATTPNREQ